MASATGGSPAQTRRILVIAIVIASLLAFGGVTAVLAIGGVPDPAELRAVSPLLGPGWRFHTGDDPRWADANFDDRPWQTLDLSAPASSNDGDVGLPNYLAGWRAHGHPGYSGYAWYRRTVTLPPGTWDILGPTAVDDGYELYWNGVKLGGSGRIGASPRVVVTRPMLFALPAEAAGRRGVLAIRAYMQPGLHGSGGSGGGLHVAPTLSPRPQSQALYRVEVWRTIAGYIVEVVEPLAMFALIGLALWLAPRSSRPDFLLLVSLALALAGLKRLDNAVAAWTDLLSLPTYVWLSKVLWAPLCPAAWTLAWNRWCLRPWRAIDGAALLLAAVGVAGGVMNLAVMTQICRLGMLAVLALVAVRMVRGGAMRLMALAVMALLLAAQYPGELGSLGVPGIWFPFGIGVTLAQFVYVLAIPLLGILIVRTAEAR